MNIYQTTSLTSSFSRAITKLNLMREPERQNVSTKKKKEIINADDLNICVFPVFVLNKN